MGVIFGFSALGIEVAREHFFKNASAVHWSTLFVCSNTDNHEKPDPPVFAKQKLGKVAQATDGNALITSL
ncbi:MAG: hypothetical protein J6I73_07180 [Treponema sp.]|nr:hypothetical protein [Treponema sp.]